MIRFKRLLNFKKELQQESQVQIRNLEGHEGKKTNDCIVCDKNFKSKGILKTHMNTMHDGKKRKPFKCTICDVHLSRKAHLQLHVSVVHDGKKPHSCIVCCNTLAQK